jgi:RND family efflux transporter MFP subunit
MFFSNRIWTAAALTVLAVGMSACGGKAPEKKAGAAPGPALAARAVKLAAEAVPEVYEATGTVRARSTTALSARIMGHIREVRVQAGDRVSAGQVVAVLDAREIETGLDTARAAREEARSGLPEVENAIAAAQAQLNLAQSTWKRMKSLHDQKSITAQEMDEADARLAMARANHQMALAKKKQLEEKIRQADSGLARVSLQKGYAEVTAPFAGIVIERKAEPGMLASPGMPIVVIEQAADYRLEAAIEEGMLSRIRPGAAASVHLDALDKAIDTRVSEIVPALDAMSRTFTARLDLPASPQIRSGLFGRARFTLGEREALTIPAAALDREGQLERVFVNDNGSARARLVTTGARHGDRLEVLSGLTAGETILVGVDTRLHDGARIEVRP